MTNDGTSAAVLTGSLRATLREATRARHSALDHAFSNLDLASAHDYARFLQVQRDALHSLAAVWRGKDAADFEAMCVHVQNDLTALNEVARRDTADRTAPDSATVWQDTPVVDAWTVGDDSTVAQGSAVADVSTAAEDFAWGVSYVIRGSRLGAKLLVRRVPKGLPADFLTCSPALTWPSFLQSLEQYGEMRDAQLRASAGTGAGAVDGIIRGAEATFSTFATLLARGPA